jgi:DNA-binding CsgD family transcriptional regulator
MFEFITRVPMQKVLESPSITKRQREVFLLRSSGMSPNETAQALGICRVAVDQHYRRAQERINRRIYGENTMRHLSHLEKQEEWSEKIDAMLKYGNLPGFFIENPYG